VDDQTEPETEPGDAAARRSLAGRLVSGGTVRAQRIAGAAGLGDALESAIEEAIVRAVESEATERAVARILNGPTLELAVAQALRSPAVEQAVTDVLDSEMTERIWGQILDSDETQQLIEKIAGSPEIRRAITAQGVGLVDQLGAGIAAVSRLVDSLVERVARRITFRRPRSEATDRVGVVTRALALAIDALVVNIALISTTAILGLLSNFLSIGIDPESRQVAALGATTWFVMASIYLFTFWAISGQTPGMRFLNIKIEPATGTRIGGRAARRRLLGFWLAVIPFGLGFLGVLLRNDRRGLHDRLGRTLVRYEDRDAEGRPIPTSQPASPPVMPPPNATEPL